MIPPFSPTRTAALYSPPAIPGTRPKLEDVREAEARLNVDALVEKAMAGEHWVRVKP